MRAGRRDRPAERRDPASPAGNQSLPQRIRDGAWHSRGSRARRRRDDVSGIPEEASRDDGDQVMMRTRFNVAFAGAALATLGSLAVFAQNQDFSKVEVHI